MRSGARARLVGIVALVAVMVAVAVGESAGPAAAARRDSAMGQKDANVRAFRGLGTWVDVYDYGPRFQGPAAPLPAVTPASVDDMARLGVKTVYLQAAQDDDRSEGAIVDRK